ncbi:MAG TPA: hypothetical protein VMT89_10785 [Candidatus Acidoferrales bacterium]|nr:hypothetical protein [Candidatus Acidoferrales bacterium]
MKKLSMGALVVSFLLVANAAMAGPAVPELDPGSASTAVALLVGALAVLNGRRKH